MGPKKSKINFLKTEGRRFKEKEECRRFKKRQYVVDLKKRISLK